MNTIKDWLIPKIINIVGILSGCDTGGVVGVDRVPRYNRNVILAELPPMPKTETEEKRRKKKEKGLWHK